MNPENWQYRGDIDTTALSKIHSQQKEKISLPQYARYQESQNEIHTLLALAKYQQTDYSIRKGIISFATPDTLSDLQKKQLRDSLKKCIPWRKGPFEICGIPLHGEWDSALKWERVRKHVGSIQGKSVLDIGCNNGYYLYHIAKQKPKFCLGIDPVIPYYQQFQILRQFAPPKNTDFGLLGIDDLIHCNTVFDVVFCMGILYHHPNPVDILKKIWQSMRPQGCLIIECQGIPGDTPIALLPKSKYGNAAGYWFLPTESALINLLHRSGFQYVKSFYKTPVEENEQRQTEWAPYGGINAMLDPEDTSKTTEGYPAPWRFYLKAYRAKKR